MSRGEGQRSGQGQVVWGLQNHIKSFRFHPETNGQLSKDFKIVNDMRFSFNSVQSFPVQIRSTGRWASHSILQRQAAICYLLSSPCQWCSGTMAFLGTAPPEGASKPSHLIPNWWLTAHHFGFRFHKNVSSPGKPICSPLFAGIWEISPMLSPV